MGRLARALVAPLLVAAVGACRGHPVIGYVLQIVNESSTAVRYEWSGDLTGYDVAEPCQWRSWGFDAGTYRISVLTPRPILFELSVPPPSNGPSTRTIVIHSDGTVDLNAPEWPGEKPVCP